MITRLTLSASLLLMPALMWPSAAAQGASPDAPCAVCPAMTLVAAGSFEMGSPDTQAGRYGNEGPLHTVRVAQFYMGTYEVTRAQFGVFVAATGHDTGQRCSTSEDGKMAQRDGRSWRNPGYPQTDADPVVCVSWDDAQAYARWLSERSGQQFTLPSEAQWEYAARAGNQAARPWGDLADGACQYANVMDATGKAQVAGIAWEAHRCDDGYAYSAPVGRFSPNRFGLHDMIGNVWEWTADCWNRSYQGAPTDGSVWTGGNCTLRANRGGGWYGEARDARSAYRDTLAADTRDANVGFRLAHAAALNLL